MAGGAYKNISVKNTLDQHAYVMIDSDFDAPGYGTDTDEASIDPGGSVNVVFDWHYHPTRIRVWCDNKWRIDYSVTAAEQAMESTRWEIRRDDGGSYLLVRT